MWEVRDRLNLDVITVTGGTLGENLEQLDAKGSFQAHSPWLASHDLAVRDVIHSPEEPLDEHGSLAVLFGEPGSRWGCLQAFVRGSRHDSV